MPSSVSIGEALYALMGDRERQMAVIVPGEVTAWDSTDESVTVQPLVRQQDGTVRPVVYQCPVVFPGAYWDIQIGEIGLLLVADQDISDWWRTGQQSTPPTRATHDINNGIFIAGLRPSTDARTHGTGVATLEKPTLTGEVRLGDQAATKAAVHEDLLTGLDTFLAALDTWGTAVGVATGVSWIAGPQPSLLTMRANIGAGNYQSPSVRVED